MKKIFLILTIIISVLYSQAQILDVPYRSDLSGCGDWCWAKTTQMLSIYYGNFYSLCEVLEEHFETGTCCTDPVNDCCAKMQYPETFNAFLNTFGLTHTFYDAPLTLTQVSYNLQLNRPFVIYVEGHVMVGYGRSGNDIYVNDPGNGSQIIDYDDFVNGIGRKAWEETFTMNNSANSCVYTHEIIGNINSATSTYKATNRINAECIVFGTSDVTLISGNDVDLKAGFEVWSGGELTIQTGCVSCP